MNNINIKELPKKFDLTLCKVNKEPLAEIPVKFIDEITKSINDMDTISLTIPYYTVDDYTKERIKNPLYDLIKDERLLCLNDTEYYVIKEDKFNKTKRDKIIKAYSREYKLGKLDIKVEDLGFYLIDKDEELGIYSLNEHMKYETGWSFGYIDELVRYDIVEGKKKEKMRWQESVNKRWYEFLTKDVAESFGCIVTFDTKNKLVNLYDINTVGEDVQIYLSTDNYLKDIERVDSSTDLVTRMFIIGNEEMDIVSATQTGYPYLEDFSYFMENDEMSPELVHAILTYESRLIELNIEWKRLTSEKLSRSETLKRKQDELFAVFEEIRTLKSILKTYEAREDEANKALTIAKITEKTDIQTKLEVEVKRLEEEIVALNSSIEEINILCKRETSTDVNGALIFNECLLDELKEFVYCETYTNDSFLNVDDLVEAGRRELKLKCKPTTTYTLDVVDFTKRIKDNNFRQHWDGSLSLGNIVMLVDDDKEVLQYFTGYTIKPNDIDSLSLTISNKKTVDSNRRVIQDKLQEASRSMSILNAKKYLWNRQKYNKFNN